jgi:nitrogen regulatory protein P-II 1
MKLIKAFIHHVRAPDVIQALADAGYRSITLHDVKGMLKPITEAERDYSTEGGALVISEVRLSLVCKDDEVDSIIRANARVGSGISGYIYVSSVEQVLPIGGPDDHAQPGSRR